MLKDKRTAMVGVLVAALFLSLLTLTNPGKALAAYDCFLKIEGEKQGKIEGEVTSKGYEGSIDIISWSFGGTQPVDSAGRASGKIVTQPFKVTMRMSKASPKLLQAFVTGEQFKTFVLDVCSSGEAASKTGAGGRFLRITLEGAKVSSIIDIGNSKSTEAYPMGEVTLNFFRKIKIEYTGAGASSMAEWDSRMGQ